MIPLSVLDLSPVSAGSTGAQALRNSLLIGLVVGAVGTLLYAVLAWVIARRTVPGAKARRYFETVHD